MFGISDVIRIIIKDVINLVTNHVMNDVESPGGTRFARNIDRLLGKMDQYWVDKIIELKLKSEKHQNVTQKTYTLKFKYGHNNEYKEVNNQFYSVCIKLGFKF